MRIPSITIRRLSTPEGKGLQEADNYKISVETPEAYYICGRVMSPRTLVLGCQHTQFLSTSCGKGEEPGEEAI